LLVLVSQRGQGLTAVEAAILAAFPAVRSSSLATTLSPFFATALIVLGSNFTRQTRGESSRGLGFEPSELPFNINSTLSQLL
jgi:hypothetical protein